MNGGLDHEVVAVSESTVRRRLRPGAEGLSVLQEAALLDVVGPLVPLPVPRVLQVWPERDEMELTRIAGVPSLEMLPSLDEATRQRLGAQLGELVAALSAIPVDRLQGVVPVDDAPMSEYVADLASSVEAFVDAVPARHQRAVLAFLSQPPPPEPATLVPTHHDLGAEHVFVDPQSLRVTGVIDWSDAAVADPALDVGLILRDLGLGAAHRALDVLGGDEQLFTRAVFHARVRALEDLIFGVAAERETYRRNALRAIDTFFGGLPDVE